MIYVNGKNLIFVLSTPRAGSTLLGSLLGNHSKMFCPSEPWLMLAMDSIRDPLTAVVSPYDHEQARAAMKQLLSDSTLDDAIRQATWAIYNSLLSNAGRDIFVDKTPRNYHILPIIDQWFPKAKKIWIRRNPLDTIASCKQTWELSVDEILGEPVSPYSFDATISFSLLADYFEESSTTKFVIDYEDLTANAELKMREICGFLGVDFEPNLIEYGQNETQMKMHAQNTMGDKKILEHKRPHRDSVGRWKQLLSPEEVGKILAGLGRDLFNRLGCENLLIEAAAFAGVAPADVSEKGTIERLLQERIAYADKKLSGGNTTHHSLAARQNAQLRAHVESFRKDYDRRLEVILEQQKTLSDLQAKLAAMESNIAEKQAANASLLRQLEESQNAIK